MSPDERLLGNGISVPLIVSLFKVQSKWNIPNEDLYPFYLIKLNPNSVAMESEKQTEPELRSYGIWETNWTRTP